MNQSSPIDDLRMPPDEDTLDRAFSAFFQRAMPRPWPPAPEAASWTLVSEPSPAVAGRTAAGEDAIRNGRVRTAYPRDTAARSRYTLAISAALLLGTCWWLSDGFHARTRTGPAASQPPLFGVLPEAGASKPAVLEERRKDRAINGDGAIAPPIQLP